MGTKRSQMEVEPVEEAGIRGDEALARAALELVPGKKVFALGVSAVTPGGVRTATVGAPVDGAFEIGSITKGLTGLLYVDALERGEVSPSTTLAELLPLGGAAAGAIELGELAQHRSGLPRLVGSPLANAMSVWALLRARDPYFGGADAVIAKLGRARLRARTPRYSNLGFAALGYALASASGLTYPALVEERIAVPGLYLPRTGGAGWDEPAVQGYDETGRAQEAWTAPEIAPAGGLRASVSAMGTLARMLVDGTAPGIGALDPTADFTPDGHVRIGAAWLTEEVDGRPVTWHNGGTGGFSSWLGLDRGRGEAVFVVGATSVEMDSVGRRLLVNLRG